MNKNIFRAWDIGLNCYVPKKVSNQLFLNMDGEVIWHSIKGGLEIVTNKFIIEFPINQKDKNNKLIFNGDIVREETGALTTVSMDDWVSMVFLESQVLEIVGNIHQDKELLDAK